MKNRLITICALFATLAIPLALHAQGKVGLINI